MSFEPAMADREAEAEAAGEPSWHFRLGTFTHTHIERVPVRRGVVVVVALLMNLFRILNSNADSKLAYYNQLPLNNRWALIVSKIGCTSRRSEEGKGWAWHGHYTAFSYDAIAIRVRTSSLIN